MKKSPTIEEIRQVLADYLPELEKEYHLESLEIFGSRLRGDNRLESDIDILVSFSSTPSLLEFIRLKNHLSKILGLEVDLVRRNALKPHIGRKIIDEAVSI